MPLIPDSAEYKPGELIQPEACQSCQWKTHDLVLCWLGTPRTAHWLCELCDESTVSLALAWRSQYRDSLPAMQTICYVGNAIIAEIRKSREPTTPPTPPTDD